MPTLPLGMTHHRLLAGPRQHLQRSVEGIHHLGQQSPEVDTVGGRQPMFGNQCRIHERLLHHPLAIVEYPFHCIGIDIVGPAGQLLLLTLGDFTPRERGPSHRFPDACGTRRQPLHPYRHWWRPGWSTCGCGVSTGVPWMRRGTGRRNP